MPMHASISGVLYPAGQMAYPFSSTLSHTQTRPLFIPTQFSCSSYPSFGYSTLTFPRLRSFLILSDWLLPVSDSSLMDLHHSKRPFRGGTCDWKKNPWVPKVLEAMRPKRNKLYPAKLINHPPLSFSMAFDGGKETNKKKERQGLGKWNERHKKTSFHPLTGSLNFLLFCLDPVIWGAVGVVTVVTVVFFFFFFFFFCFG